MRTIAHVGDCVFGSAGGIRTPEPCLLAGMSQKLSPLSPIRYTMESMIHGNFIGAAIVAVIYTIYLLMNPGAVKSRPIFIAALIVLNALTIVLVSLAFK